MNSASHADDVKGKVETHVDPVAATLSDDEVEDEKKDRAMQRKVGDGLSSMGSACPRITEDYPSNTALGPPAAPLPKPAEPSRSVSTEVTATPRHTDVITDSPLNSSGDRFTEIEKQSGSPKLGRQRTERCIKKGKKLGQGGFGEVYMALDQQSGEFLAVKHVKHNYDMSGESEAIKQLKNEIHLMRKLNHPCIVHYMGMEVGPGYVDIYMEYVPGGSLKDVLDSFGGTFPDELCSIFTRQIINGLVYLHAHNVVHRDIKAANILLHGEGDIRLADFGAAVQLANMTSKEPQKLGGTALWMPPEVLIQGTSAPVLACQDIWSLGCTIVEMLTAKPPFRWIDESDEVVVQSIANCDEPVSFPDSLGFSSKAKEFLHMCLQKDASKRPQAKDLLDTDYIRLSEDAVKAKEMPDELQSPSKRKKFRWKDGLGTPGKMSPGRSSRASPGKRKSVDSAHVDDPKNPLYRKLIPTYSFRKEGTDEKDKEKDKQKNREKEKEKEKENTEKGEKEKESEAVEMKTKTPSTVFGSPSASIASPGQTNDEKRPRERQRPQKMSDQSCMQEITCDWTDKLGLKYNYSLNVESVEMGSPADISGMGNLTGWTIIRVNDMPATSELLNKCINEDNRITFMFLMYTEGTEVEVKRKSGDWHRCEVSTIERESSEILVFGYEGAENCKFSKRIGFGFIDNYLRSAKPIERTPSEPPTTVAATRPAPKIEELMDLDESKNLIERRGVELPCIDLGNASHSPVCGSARSPLQAAQISSPHVRLEDKSSGSFATVHHSSNAFFADGTPLHSPGVLSPSAAEDPYHKVFSLSKARAKANEWTSPRFRSPTVPQSGSFNKPEIRNLQLLCQDGERPVPGTQPASPSMQMPLCLPPLPCDPFCASLITAAVIVFRMALTKEVMADLTTKDVAKDRRGSAAVKNPILAAAMCMEQGHGLTIQPSCGTPKSHDGEAAAPMAAPSPTMTEIVPASTRRGRANTVTAGLTPNWLPERERAAEIQLLKNPLKKPESVKTDTPDSEILPVTRVPTGHLWNKRTNFEREGLTGRSVSHTSSEHMTALEAESISIDIDEDDGVEKEPHGLHNIPLLVASLRTRVALKDCTNDERLGLVHKAINTASTPHLGILQFLKAHNWTVEYGFKKLLTVGEADDLEEKVRNKMKIAAPQLISVIMRKDATLGVTWVLHSVGGFVAVEVEEKSLGEQAGIQPGMKLISIEGVGVATDDELQGLLKAASQYPSALFAFNDGLVDLPISPERRREPSRQERFRALMSKKAHSNNIIIIFLLATAIVLCAIVFNLYILILLLFLPLTLIF
eukprot:TRINITY_DN1203_c2_g1_i3.p1 TRINITY_DN1203_c2_g1~~TRINITY_DN1203_c2_g1_i3.p1  ORF type:complete len:1311 (+),score=310.15 TRINITY_DN1203_c2_g1_i3:60-3992(+)